MCCNKSHVKCSLLQREQFIIYIYFGFLMKIIGHYTVFHGLAPSSDGYILSKSATDFEV